MNILHIIQDMNIGGAQRVLYNIAKRMKNDHHIVLTYQVCDEYKELLRQLLNTEVKVIMNMGEFVRAIQDYTYDIVHYHWWPGMKVMGTIFEKEENTGCTFIARAVCTTENKRILCGRKQE